MASDEQPTFGELLRRHRVLGGLSQEELAEQAGLSARAISDLEREVKRTPRRDTVQLLVEALSLTGEARAAFIAAAREPASRPSPHPTGARGSAGAGAPTSMLPVGGFLGALAEHALVGRGAEVAAMLTAVQATRQGAGRLLTLAGEPGVGKTRLAQEIARLCWDQSFLVATGRCYEPHQAVPYYPFLEALSTLYVAAPDTVRAEVGARWPALLRLLPHQVINVLPAAAAGVSPQEEQQRLFWAVTGLVQAVADRVPVALLLDDLQWADDASLALLQHIARHTRAHRVLLLGTYRDSALGRHHPLRRALHDLEREQLVERLAVRRLTREGTASLIADRLGQDLPEEFTTMMQRHTDGHPLFVQEVLRALIERGDLYRQHGRWERKEIAALDVPDSVRAAIADRAVRLSERAQEALRAASVLGQAFTFEDLQALAEQAEDELEAALEEAVAARLLDETGDGYVFNHALTQQALYTGLSMRQRKRAHLAAAEALERLPEPVRRGRAAELTWHFQESGAPARALPYALLAGDQAAAVYAAVEAEQQYRRAAELGRTLADRAGEALALEKLGWLLWMVARFDACREALEAAARAYRALGDAEGEMRAVGLLGMLHFSITPLEGAERIETLLGRLGPRDPSPPLTSLYASLAMNLAIAGRYRAARDAATRAAALARALGDERLQTWAEMTRGVALGRLGRLADGREVLAAWLPVAEAANDYFGQLMAVHYLGELCLHGGDFAAAMDYYGRALDLAERLGARGRISAEVSNLSEILFLRGDWARARGDAERAVDMACATSSGVPAAYYQHANVIRRLGVIRAATGDREAALPYLQEAVVLAERIPFPDAAVSGHAALAEQEILRGHPEAALVRLEPLVQRSDPEELATVRLLPPLAWAYLELGHAAHAEAVAREGIERATWQGQKVARVELLLVYGRSLARQLHWAAAERAFEEAVAAARTLPYPFAEGRALWEWGRLSATKGEVQQARARLAATTAIFERLGAHPYTERARQALTDLAQRRHEEKVDLGWLLPHSPST